MPERKSPFDVPNITDITSHINLSDITSHGAAIPDVPGLAAQPLNQLIVLRRDDLLFLIFYFVNLGRKLLPAGDTVLVRLQPNAPTYIIVQFPPQSIAEEAVFQAVSFTPPPKPPKNPPDFDPPLSAAVSGKFPSTADARLSGLSQLAFEIPASVQSIPFTLAELLAWHKWLPHLAVPTSAHQRPDILVTAIEAPYRLLISPAASDSVWRHRIETGKLGNRVELWHTKLSLPQRRAVSGSPLVKVQPLQARVIWARDFNPTGIFQTTPAVFQNPFRTSLSPRQRTELVMLTSAAEDKFGLAPIEVEQLMLTPLGAYLHLHGEWNLQQIKDKLGLTLKVSEWRHRATLGRDHYVRVVEEGVLFPFGHRAALVTITERRFTAQGAYLIQQMFVIIREPVRTLSLSDKVKTSDGRRVGLLMPFKSLRITTLSTPPIEDPGNGIAQKGTDAFWIKVNKQEMLFHFVGEDWAGQTSEFVAPVIFVSNAVTAPLIDATGAPVPGVTPPITSIINEYNAAKEALRRVALAGRQVAFAAPSSTSGLSDTSYETQSLTFNAVATVSANGTPPPLPFHPAMQQAAVRIAAVEHMTGAAAASTIQYFGDYTKNGLQGGEVFAQVSSAKPALNFNNQAQRSGGLFTPNFTVNGLSRKAGTVGGDLQQFNGDTFSPTSFFAGLDPKLLGCVSLSTLIAPGGSGSAPRLVSAPVYDGAGDVPVAFETTFDWKPQVVTSGDGLLQFDSPQGLTLSVKLRANLQGGAPTFDIRGELKSFHINLVKAIQINFDSLTFSQPAGQKMDVSATLGSPTVRFLGPLAFLNQLTAFIEAAGFEDPPSLDVDASGARLGYTLALPDLTVGSYALQNIKLSSALNVPFSSQPVRFRFGFGERHDPFLVTVSAVAGGGYVGISVGADGIEAIEASLEFGGNIAINLGVASGGVTIMGGFHIGSSKDELTFSAYIRACGALEVLGLICVTVEFYLGLNYSKPTGGQARLSGTATMTVEVEVVFFSKSVNVTMERTLLGSAGDPTFTQMMNRRQWAAYRSAFATD